MSAPARGGRSASARSLAFAVGTRFCVARLCGRAGRLTALRGGFRPGGRDATGQGECTYEEFNGPHPPGAAARPHAAT